MARRRNPTLTAWGRDYEIGPEADLRSANLAYALLVGANLVGADLTDANLARANLEGANLVGARLRYAALGRANLRNANLQNATLSNAILSSVYLTGANLQHADLQNANLDGARLQNADLRSADLEGAMPTGADLFGATLADANLPFADLDRANLEWANLERANLAGANLQNANLRNANLQSADLGETDLTDALCVDANLQSARLRNANLRNANLAGADLTDGANLEGANLEGANLEGANLEGAIMPARPARSYGAMTGPILKIGKPDSPSKAADFKRRYPAEFERLKGDTGGRDFTEGLRESLREKYRTPFDWVVTGDKYRSHAQRLSSTPNKVMLLNVNTKDDRYTEKQRDLLEKLAYVSRRSGHPHANPPLFTIGWVRYAQDDEHGVLLIEEVQSDVEVVRTKMKGDTEENEQLRSAGIDPEEYAEVLDLLRPYSARFYEDAIGLVYQEAEALGYTVEMLGYEDKKGFGSPRSIYTDLPKRLGMSQKRESEVPTREPLQDRVSYYKPNPAKRPRRRRR